LGNNIRVQHSVGPIITLDGRITAREYVDRLGNQVHPMIRRYFRTTKQFSKITTGTVESWFEENEDELHLPWLTQARNLNIIEPLWFVLETGMRNRFSPTTCLKGLEDVLHEEWYKTLLEIVQNLYKSIPRRIAAVLKTKGGPTRCE
jgi:hypothetical protein